MELIGYFQPAEPGQIVRAVPGAGLEVPIWILGSSTFGARLAARLGLPYAFASHFAPAQLMSALELYRSEFRPSEQLSRPYVMLGINVFAADDDRQARRLLTSLERAFVDLRRGRPSQLAPPVDEDDLEISPLERAALEQLLTCTAVGSPETVYEEIRDFVSLTHPDELIVVSQIHDHAARLRSYEITAQVRDRLAAG
jgi:luciferase family oxidoreductase group 1